MPETVISDKYIDQIPGFKLPPELTNPKPEPEAPPAAPPKEEAKPATEAVAPEPEKEPAEETTGKDPEKATTRRFERRIDRAIRARAEAQAKAELLERELRELKEKQSPRTDDAAPRMENFTDVQEYAKAYAAYETGKALQEREARNRAEFAQRSQAKLSADWESSAAKASAKYDDFEEAVGELKPTTPWAVAIMQAENGAEIAYFLGKNIKEAERIIGLDPVSQIREIGKLEWKLSLTPEAPKKPSKAPAPIAPVAAPAQVSNDEIQPQMPYEQYMKVGNKMFRGR